MVTGLSGDFGACGGGDADIEAAAEHCSAWTDECVRPYTITQIESPKVMFWLICSAAGNPTLDTRSYARKK